MKALSILAALLLSFPNLQAAQQASAPAPSNSPQAATLLARSAAALTGNVALSDVTLTGTARRIAGSDDESGTAVLKAIAGGASHVDLSLSSGQRSEVHNVTTTEPTGAWSGPDRVSHPIAFHNLLSEPAWFFPSFAIARRLSSGNHVATYIGQETIDGHSVEHISVSQLLPFTTSSTKAEFERLTQVEFFLDSSTLLPFAITFNTHPDENALMDIPIEVRFSDYRAVNGAQVPFRVQKYLNNGLILDFQAESATFNTGLPASAFNAQ
jgi:hypothetical protein